MSGNHQSGRKMKPIAQHLENGTFRPGRHGKKLAALMAMSATTPATGTLSIIGSFSDEEKQIADTLLKVLPNIPPRMSVPFQVFVEDLALYRRTMADIQTQGLYEVGSQGQRVPSAAFKARTEVLNHLRKDFSAFALSAGEQADIMNTASRIRERNEKYDRMRKPDMSEGKPLE